MVEKQQLVRAGGGGYYCSLFGVEARVSALLRGATGAVRPPKQDKNPITYMAVQNPGETVFLPVLPSMVPLLLALKNKESYILQYFFHKRLF